MSRCSNYELEYSQGLPESMTPNFCQSNGQNLTITPEHTPQMCEQCEDLCNQKVLSLKRKAIFRETEGHQITHGCESGGSQGERMLSVLSIKL